MGVATVFLIPSRIEPLFWILIFAITAFLIATRGSAKYFQHGVVVGIANSVWVTASHVLLFERYIANHPQEAAMMTSMPLPDSPRLMMVLVGPLIGLVSGLIIGLAVIAARVVAARANRLARRSSSSAEPILTFRAEEMLGNRPMSDWIARTRSAISTR
jgi:hypothetical protein